MYVSFPGAPMKSFFVNKMRAVNDVFQIRAVNLSMRLDTHVELFIYIYIHTHTYTHTQ